MDHVPELVWLCIVGLFSVIYSVLNAIFMLPFWKYRNSRFITSRKPSLLLFYGVLSSMLLFVVIPNICFIVYELSMHGTHLSEAQLSIYFFVFDITFEATFITLVHVIAVRAWLLFYDYKFAMATVDRVWRKVIAPSERNFFLLRRSSFGNSTFLLKAVIVVWLLLLCVISGIAILYNTYFASSQSTTPTLLQMDEVIFFTIKVAIGLPVVIFVFQIHRKIHQINDQFNIKNEVKYLSFMVLFVICTSLIALVLLIFGGLPLHLFEVVVYTFDVFFVVGSCYIQSKWALHSLLRQTQRVDTEPSDVPLSMADILRNKHSFEAFMRHCVDELSVEGLLFLVEVAQYKATLASYNVTDAKSNYLSLNVKTENLREYLLNSRKQKHLEEEPNLTVRSNSLRNGGLQRQGSNTARSSNAKLAFSMMFRNVKSNDYDAEDDSDQTGYEKQTTPQPVSPHSPIPGLATAHRTDAHVLSQFRQFQQSILDRKWLPISMQLNVQKPGMATSLITADELPSKSLRNLRLTVADHKDVVQLEMATANSYSVSAVSPEPSPNPPSNVPSDQPPIRERVGTDSVLRSPPSIRAGVGSLSSPSCAGLVTSEDLRDIALFLYEKYVKTDSDWSINIASDTRAFLQDLFSLPSEKMFDYILEHSGGKTDKNPHCPAAINTQMLINTYIYHVYDAAFEEVWQLLHKDTFRRFIISKAYRKLVKIWRATKEEEDKVVDSGIYSKSSTHATATEQP